MCTCLREVDFTDSIIRDVLIAGTRPTDLDIRREVLGTSATIERGVNDVTSVVESKELARNALHSSASGIPFFKLDRPASAAQPPPSDRSQTALCSDCKQTFTLFSEGPRGWNTRPHHQCMKCYQAAHRLMSMLPDPRPQIWVPYSRASVIAKRLMWGQPAVTPASPTPQTTSPWSGPS